MKKGYDVFGKSYGIMYKNDLHDVKSIDHEFMRNMILLDEETKEFLYQVKPKKTNINNHSLNEFSQKFKAESEYIIVQNVVGYTLSIAYACDTPIEDMKFGGTEDEIIKRGTDWCADMARVATVLLICLEIPARILHLANLEKAYFGHVVVEAFYEGKWGVIDPIYGYCFYDNKPIDAWQLQHDKEYLVKYDDDYAGFFMGIAINDYEPCDCNNVYITTKANEYTLLINHTNHQGKWFMGEDR